MPSMPSFYRSRRPGGAAAIAGVTKSTPSHPARGLTALFALCATALLFAGGVAAQSKRKLTIDDQFRLQTVRDPQISPDGSRVAYTVRTVDAGKDKSETALWVVSTDGGERLRMTAPGYSASRPRWSPDGRYLAFLASRSLDPDEDEAETQVWAFDLRGGDALPLTGVEQGVDSYEWSPDSRSLALVIRDPEPEAEGSDKDKGKKDRPKPIVVDRLQFKRDYAGYLDRRRDHIYRFDLEGERLVQLTRGDYDDSDPAWSPDGRWIVFVSNRTEEPDANENADLWLVAADPASGPAPVDEGGDGAPGEETPGESPSAGVTAETSDESASAVKPPQPGPRRLTDNPGRDWSPAWSPDGSLLAYRTVTRPEIIWYATTRLAVIAIAEDGTASQPNLLLPDLDRNLLAPGWAPDGRSIYALLEDRGAQVLAQLDRGAEGVQMRRPIDGERSISAFSVGDSGKVALLQSTWDQPPEVFVYDARGVRQLSFSNRELMDDVRLGRVEKETFSSEDGTEVEGFLTFPPDHAEGARHPTLLRIHGGPVSQYDWEFDFDSQLFAANGYLVVRVNPRGSSGYGEDFSHAIWADWGNKDFQDVMAGVDHAIALGHADPERLGVGGWSYGGILTNYVITKTDRFDAAITGASEVLYVSNYGHDHYQLEWETELGLPWESRETWERISPFNDVEKIVTPTLILGGALDWNVPILNSEQLYQALKRLGRETQLVVYPNEHHGIRRPSFQKDRLQRYLGWYGKYVK